MSYLFIVNPIAGKGRAKKTIPIIKEIMENNNCSYQIKVTKKRGMGNYLRKKQVLKIFLLLLFP
ncbi:MAG TPA: diacylglycerol kinase family protein [Clostridia bacterium]|nr:diacylglycerol kinase family protein [Clostridia bacterium]